MFQALELSLQVVQELRPVVARLRSRDPDLSRQIRRAGSSVPLNLAEGRHRRGADRLQHYRVAAGSADEIRCALRVAEAWGDVQARDLEPCLRSLDQLLAILWRLTH